MHNMYVMRSLKIPRWWLGPVWGGWISVLLALDRPQKIMGMVGLASAPDFTQRLIEPNLSNDQIQQLQDQGKCYLPSLYGNSYPITTTLLEDARQNLVLSDALPLHIPLHLIHGTEDTDVPWEESFCLLHLCCLNTATPGSSFPSSHARKAPPAVETWVKWGSVPVGARAATVSPPPTIEVSFLSCVSFAMKWAIWVVPPS